MPNAFEIGDPLADRRSTRKTIHKFAKLDTPWGAKVQLKTQCGRWLWPPDCETPIYDNPRCTVCFKAEPSAVPVLDQYFIHAIEHARMRLVKEPRCQECTTTIEALDRLIEAAGGVSQA